MLIYGYTDQRTNPKDVHGKQKSPPVINCLDIELTLETNSFRIWNKG